MPRQLGVAGLRVQGGARTPWLRHSGGRRRNCHSWRRRPGSASEVARVSYRRRGQGTPLDREEGGAGLISGEWKHPCAHTVTDRVDESSRPSGHRGRTKDPVDACRGDRPSDQLDGVTPELSAARPGVALLRRDWEFLFEQLKSTSAVVGYFERVAGETIALGEEPVRYHDLAQADEQAPSGSLQRSPVLRKGKRRSAPILPVEPLSVEAARLVRLILEDVAVTRSEASEEQRLRMLAELDRLPVAYREETGKFLAKSLRDVTARPDGTEWRLRQVVGSDETALLGFGACSEYSELVLAAFRAWLVLRHHQLQNATGKVAELTSTGVLSTPRHDGKRTWDTTVITAVGELEFTQEELQGFESSMGQTGELARAVMPRAS